MLREGLIGKDSKRSYILSKNVPLYEGHAYPAPERVRLCQSHLSERHREPLAGIRLSLRTVWGRRNTAIWFSSGFCGSARIIGPKRSSSRFLPMAPTKLPAPFKKVPGAAWSFRTIPVFPLSSGSTITIASTRRTAMQLSFSLPANTSRSGFYREKSLKSSGRWTISIRRCVW